MENLSNNLICNISKIYRKLTNLYSNKFNKLDLTITEALIISNLEVDDYKCPSELAKIIHLDKSTISRFLDKLEYKKLISRYRCGKKQKLTLTIEGKKIQKQVIDTWKNLSDVIENQISNLDIFLTMLDEIDGIVSE